MEEIVLLYTYFDCVDISFKLIVLYLFLNKNLIPLVVIESEKIANKTRIVLRSFL